MPTDYDNRRDLDILVVNRDGPPALLANQRDGTFRDIATDVGFGGIREATAVVAGDINKDNGPDLYLATPAGGVFAMSSDPGPFTLVTGPAGAAGAIAAQLIDYDNDGLLDLLTWTDGPHVFPQHGSSP